MFVTRRFKAIVAVVALTVVSCSSGAERSAEAFCDTLRSEKERILDQLEGAQAAAESTDDGFAAAILALGGSIQALGELQTYFQKLAKVAPEEIRTEAEIVAAEYEEQMDAAGNAASDPLGAFGQTLFGGLAISGQLNALNEFALEHCGESI